MNDTEFRALVAQGPAVVMVAKDDMLALLDEVERLREALESARADALREAIGIANERGAWASNDLDADSLKDRLEANGRMDMAKEIADAIRAAGGGA